VAATNEWKIGLAIPLYILPAKNFLALSAEFAHF
jgi:hypothetical protein